MPLYQVSFKYLDNKHDYISPQFIDFLGENLTLLNSNKLKSYLLENVVYWCYAIFIDAERFASSGDFKPEHIGFINNIYEDNSD